MTLCKHMENTPIKMKSADLEQVTATMVEAIQNSLWFADDRDPYVPNLVRDIQAALVGIGVVMFQPDL